MPSEPSVVGTEMQTKYVQVQYELSRVIQQLGFLLALATISFLPIAMQSVLSSSLPW